MVVLHVFSALTKYSEETVGYITIELFIPAVVPPQEPEYQFHIAPDPAWPPEIPRITESVVQIVVFEARIESAGEEFVWIRIVVLKQFVVLHNPSALAK